MPNVNAINCFLATARCGSFTKAADALFMTRQAVSRQIAQLEQELDVQLFARTTAKVELTSVGEFYVNSFLDLIHMWEEIRRKADEISTEKGMQVNIGCLYDLDLGDHIYHIINDLHSQGEHFYVRWERQEPEQLLEDLISGHFDLVFTFERDIFTSEEKGLLSSCVFQEGEAVIVVRDSHPMAKPEATAEDFQTGICIMAEQKLRDARALEEFHAQWASSGLKFQDIRIVPNRENMQTKVEMGEGFTVGTTMERFPHYPHMVTYPIRSAKKLSIRCVWRTDESREQVLQLISAIQTLNQ